MVKKEGDNIKSGDIIAEVETDKATMEVEAIDEGVLQKLYIMMVPKILLLTLLLVLFLLMMETTQDIEMFLKEKIIKLQKITEMMMLMKH